MNSDHNTTEVHGNAALATTINNKGCVLLRFDSPATTIDNVACNLIQYILLSLPCIKLNPLYLSILFFFFFSFLVCLGVPGALSSLSLSASSSTASSSSSSSSSLPVHYHLSMASFLVKGVFVLFFLEGERLGPGSELLLILHVLP